MHMFVLCIIRSNDEEEEDVDEEETCRRDLSDESFLLRDSYPEKNVTRECSTAHHSITGQGGQRTESLTCRTEILSRKSTRLANKIPRDPNTRPPSKPNPGELS